MLKTLNYLTQTICGILIGVYLFKYIFIYPPEFI